MCEESLYSGLVALHELTDQCLGVFVGIIFCRELILMTIDIGNHIERHPQGEVAEFDGFHGFSHHLGFIEKRSMPHKRRADLQVEVGLQIGVGIGGVLAAAVHLVLAGFQEVKYSGLVGKLGIDGQGLYRHAYGALETLVGTSVINGGKQ